MQIYLFLCCGDLGINKIRNYLKYLINDYYKEKKILKKIIVMKNYLKWIKNGINYSNKMLIKMVH